MPWAARRRARRTRRALRFTGRLDYRLATPPDADGRPGWELMAPSRSPYIGVMGSPEELAAFSIDATQAMGAARCTVPPTECRLVGLPAVGYTMTFNSGAVLQEWKLAYEGWVYGFGVLVHDDEGLAAHQLAREALATFRWIPPIPHAAGLGG